MRRPNGRRPFGVDDQTRPGRAESEMARAQKVLDGLTAEVAGTVDHLELARLGEGIRAAGAEVDVAEERWLALSQ